MLEAFTLTIGYRLRAAGFGLVALSRCEWPVAGSPQPVAGFDD